MAGCQEMLKSAYFSPLFCHFRPYFFFSCRTAYSIFKVVYQASLIPKIRKTYYELVAEKCSKTHIFHTFFAIFRPKNFFLAKLLVPYLKQYIRLVLYKNQKNLWTGCRDVLKNAYFPHAFRHLRPKICFFAKLPMPYLKQYIRLVLNQKSEKSMDWLPRNAKKCIFFTPFSPFLAKKIFLFKNPASSVFWNYKKLP